MTTSTRKSGAKPAAAKTAAKKPVARKLPAKQATAKRTASPKVVRHGAVERSASSSRSTVMAGLGIDRESLLRNLVRLSGSKDDAVALAATKELLTLVR